MDKNTLEALKGSIRKWEGIVAGTIQDKGPTNCPLCYKFIFQECVGCPVRKATKQTHCQGTPYVEYKVAEDDYGGDSDDAKEAAQRELDFLKSLIPESKSK